MNQPAYLTFRMREVQYALAVDHVREIFPLPALIPVPEAPGDILGLLNVRGKVVPVMHLDRRLGQPLPPCQISDSVILMEWHGLQMGMVVHQVAEVEIFDPAQVTPEVSYGRDDTVPTAFLQGVAQTETGLTFLLNPEALIRLTDEGLALVTALEAEPLEPEWGDFYTLHCPTATAADRDRFAQRAADLRLSPDGEQTDALMALAVIEVDGQTFGLPLDHIREFIRVPKVSPIPGCPRPIVGHINLRGEVITLMDMRAALHLSTPPKPLTQAVIVEGDDLVVGLTVDEVRDIVFLAPTEIAPLPIAVRGSQTSVLQGLAPYGNGRLGVLAVSKLLTPDGLRQPVAA